MTTFNHFSLVNAHIDRIVLPRRISATYNAKKEQDPADIDDLNQLTAAFGLLDGIVDHEATAIMREMNNPIGLGRELLGDHPMRVVHHLWNTGHQFEAAFLITRIWAEVTARQRAKQMPEWTQEQLLAQLPGKLKTDDWTASEMADLVAILT
ncbi:Uncharacterised protein [Mycobacteroides abscessus subsp. abscessus]|uniref:hypothetical protein n=1 Tax=Mycobacteroides abscessus TaxID=36809 RepID=UPI00092977BC|nr:hypothetical protein [Mycobacteroides abscessus]SIJ21314.1 Uncharacterised protein [Mycobacteroides abscessus subsp. abscessus]SLH39165.1 Uncharacterised protein [Mycobacteroides abscessus subsp. abscessus]